MKKKLATASIIGTPRSNVTSEIKNDKKRKGKKKKKKKERKSQRIKHDDDYENSKPTKKNKPLSITTSKNVLDESVIPANDRDENGKVENICNSSDEIQDSRPSYQRKRKLKNDDDESNKIKKIKTITNNNPKKIIKRNDEKKKQTKKTTATTDTTTTTTTATETKTNKIHNENNNNKRLPKISSSPKKCKGVLNGLTLAVSTLDVKAKKHECEESSYKAVVSLCQSLGATITGQVHQRVFAVICNQTAVAQMTQRVRKAIKRNLFLIDVEWIRQCQKQSQRLDYTSYLLSSVDNNTTKKTATTKNDDAETIETKILSHLDDNKTCIDIGEYTGWTEAISLDCCCVCHENGDFNCKWCVSCNITLARKQAENKG